MLSIFKVGLTYQLNLPGNIQVIINSIKLTKNVKYHKSTPHHLMLIHITVIINIPPLTYKDSWPSHDEKYI